MILSVLVHRLVQSAVPSSPVRARVLRWSLRNFRFPGRGWSLSTAGCLSSRPYSPFRHPRRRGARARRLADCRRMRGGPQLGEWVRRSGSGGSKYTCSPPLAGSLREENLGGVFGVRSAVLLHRQRYPRTINKRVNINARRDESGVLT